VTALGLDSYRAENVCGDVPRAFTVRRGRYFLVVGRCGPPKGTTV